ncbi:MAG: 4-alpha-glucanotransferase, partial [Spirochaetota bacterium]
MKFAHPESRHSGIVVALSALRSESSHACGEFPDLVLLGDLARSWNFDLVQLLPVNDTGGMSSPYTALSAFALHPLYLRLSDLPEARSRPEFAQKARALADMHAADERFAYGPYRAAKLALLEELFTASRGKREADAWLEAVGGFPDWLEENSWVKGYAIFSELKRRAGGKPWWEWARYRDPGAAG